MSRQRQPFGAPGVHRRVAVPIACAVVALVIAAMATEWQFRIVRDDEHRETVTVNQPVVTQPVGTEPPTSSPVSPTTPSRTVKFSTAATQPPLKGRGDAAAASHGDSIIFWWGNDTGAADTAAYDLSTRTWRVLAQPSRVTSRNKPVLLDIGARLLLWGGRATDGPLEFPGGATLDPATSSWTAIADSPIGGRNSDGAAIAWTGSEMLVWGGRVDDARGAAYNPTTNKWRQIAPSPLTPRRGAAFAWTGTELVIWGGEGFDQSSNARSYPADGAAYNPLTDTWRSLPAILIPGRQAAGVWTGSEFIILGGVSTFSLGQLLHETGAAYDPATDRWRQLPRGWSQPGLNNLLLQRFIIAWDGKFYFAYEIATGALLDIDYQGPDLILSDKAFAIPNGIAAGGIRDKTLH